MAPLTSYLLEIAAFDLQSAIAAAKAGADRIELCKARETGGLTPDLADLRLLRRHVGSVPVNVMIRARPGTDFTADRDQLHRMTCDILKFQRLADGFVFGVLDREGNIDVKTNWDLVKVAYPKPCTFHRAFDYAQGDNYAKLETVRRCGFTTILTSGGPGDAEYYADNLRSLVTMATSMEITVMVGGGVRSGNLEELLAKTSADAYHTSAITSSNAAGAVDTDEIAAMRSIFTDLPD